VDGCPPLRDTCAPVQTWSDKHHCCLQLGMRSDLSRLILAGHLGKRRWAVCSCPMQVKQHCRNGPEDEDDRRPKNITNYYGKPNPLEALCCAASPCHHQELNRHLQELSHAASGKAPWSCRRRSVFTVQRHPEGTGGAEMQAKRNIRNAKGKRRRSRECPTFFFTLSGPGCNPRLHTADQESSPINPAGRHESRLTQCIQPPRLHWPICNGWPRRLAACERSRLPAF
jgi:hypothetical protein